MRERDVRPARPKPRPRASTRAARTCARAARRSAEQEAGLVLLLLVVLLERRGRAEALSDELLQALLLLVQARARQQQHAIAGLEPRDDLAVLEVREARLDRDRHRLIAAHRHDPVVAAEQIIGISSRRPRAGLLRRAADEEATAAATRRSATG